LLSSVMVLVERYDFTFLSRSVQDADWVSLSSSPPSDSSSIHPQPIPRLALLEMISLWDDLDDGIDLLAYRLLERHIPRGESDHPFLVSLFVFLSAWLGVRPLAARVMTLFLSFRPYFLYIVYLSSPSSSLGSIALPPASRSRVVRSPSVIFRLDHAWTHIGRPGDFPSLGFFYVLSSSSILFWGLSFAYTPSPQTPTRPF
jgi:hypothetical protein